NTCIVIHFQYYRYLNLSTSLLFIHTPTTKISTLSLHDALPIFHSKSALPQFVACQIAEAIVRGILISFAECRIIENLFDEFIDGDRKSTCLNSSHLGISYAVFCLKKKCLIPCSNLAFSNTIETI